MNHKLKISLIAIGISFLISFVIVLITGYSVISTIQGMLSGIGVFPFNLTKLGNILYIATPLTLTGLSVALGLKSGLFNIGAEGQFLIGGVVGMTVLVTPELAFLPGIIIILLAIIASSIAGGLWGLIPGFLKAKFEIHEVVVSIMANYIALYTTMMFFSQEIISVSETNKQMSTLPNASFSIIPSDVLGTRFGFQVFIALALVFLFTYVITKTKFGYELRMIGNSKTAAKYAGINVKRNILLSFFISGALAGLGGLFYYGPAGNMYSPMGFSNIGFDGIGVALIGGVTGIGALFAALFIGAMKTASLSIQALAGVPVQLVQIITGIAVFLVGANYFIEKRLNKKIKFKRKRDK